jgi:hypothetical protein
VTAAVGGFRILREVLIAAIAYSPFMSANRRQLAAIDGTVDMPKTVAAQRLVAATGNYREPSAAKAGVAV